MDDDKLQHLFEFSGNNVKLLTDEGTHTAGPLVMMLRATPCLAGTSVLHGRAGYSVRMASYLKDVARGCIGEPSNDNRIP